MNPTALRTVHEARYRSLFERAPWPILIHRRGVIVEANEAAAAMLGYASGELLAGVDLTRHHDPADFALARERAARLKLLPPGTALAPAAYTLHSRDGRIVQAEVATLRVALDDGLATMSFYLDVTAQRDAQRDAHRSQTLLAQVFATTPDIAVLVDSAAGRCIMVNQRFTEVCGWTADEAIGRTMVELGFWKRATDREHAAAQLAESGCLRDFNATFGTKSGRRLRLSMNGAKFRLDDSEYFIVIARDISQADLAQLEREAIMQRASIGLCFTRNSKFTQANAAFESIFGWGPGELIGQPGSVVWPSPEDYAEIGRVAGPALAAGKRVELERPARRRDGTVFLCRFEAQVVDPDDPAGGGTIWVVEDVTQRRAAERALAQARDAADTASRAKSSFLASTSHEIRTPLNALLGLAQLARDPDLADVKRRQYLDQIVESARGLADVISDILDISKIEAGKLVLESVAFDLPGLVQATCRSFEAMAAAAGLTLDVALDSALPPVVRGDPVRVRQILANYLGNAIKFTAHGAIRVEAGSEGELILLRVIDTGPVLDDATRERLFRPFTQADESTTRRHGGTGLGLSICRELAHLMGGEVGVESAPGDGSSFWARLALPRAIAAEVGPQDSAALARVLDGARVLLVEDNAVNMMIAAAMLEQWRVRVTQAVDGQQALDAVDRAQAEGSPFDAVLMDVQMPVMSGHEAARRLRQRYDRDSLPIIAFTAAAMVDERQQALGAGMDAFLTKPIDMEQLKRTLARAIGGREAVPSVLGPLGL